MEAALKLRSQIVTGVFILGLLLTGATAIPLLAEVDCLVKLTGAHHFTEESASAPAFLHCCRCRTGRFLLASPHLSH